MHNPPGTPLGVDIYLTVYGFADSLARDLFFLKYEVANASGRALNQVYFGMVVDADIGDPTDDMSGLILNKRFQVGSDTLRVRNTGFFYDYDNIETPGALWEGGIPGAVALRLLDAPAGLGLTAFKRFTIDIDPITDAEQYLTLKGYNYRTGEYEPYASIDPLPSDKRALLASGPFDLLPDSVVTFWFAVIGAPHGDSAQLPEERDTTELALRCWRAEQVWQRLLGILESGAEPPITRREIIYPNPCPRAGVLQIAVEGPVFIYDRTGRLLKVIANPGKKVWDGRDEQGRLVPAGVYFLITGFNRETNTRVVILGK